jgi:hypothetical protein
MSQYEDDKQAYDDGYENISHSYCKDVFPIYYYLMSGPYAQQQQNEKNNEVK